MIARGLSTEARIPARYARAPAQLFEERVRSQLRAYVRVLDVGSGRSPVLAPSERPYGTYYVGLDLSEPELRAAPEGSYDATLAADIGAGAARPPSEFDLVVCRQVLEHVQDVERALSNLRGCLRKGGTLLALLSGRFSINAVLNSAIPAPVSAWLLRRLLDREPDTVFAAYYDRCYDSALVDLLRPWAQAEVTPMFQGAAYLSFAAPLRSAYLAYENWADRTGRANLATHYMIAARR